jgi:hypothetical protein
VVGFHAGAARRHQTYNESTQNYALHGAHLNQQNENETTGRGESGKDFGVRARNEAPSAKKKVLVLNLLRALPGRWAAGATEQRSALGLAEFLRGLPSIADRDLAFSRSVGVVLARALRELTSTSSHTGSIRASATKA